MTLSRRRTHSRNLLHMPVKVWLFLVIIAGIAHPFLNEGRWLLVHLFTLGAVTNSVVMWGRHCARRKSQPPLALIGLLNLGIILVVAGKILDQWIVLCLGAVLVIVALLWHSLALLRLRAWWYGLSALCLPLGATFGVLIVSPAFPNSHDRLLLGHEIINLLGFLGCAAMGTLITMFPAVWRTRAHPSPIRLNAVLMASGIVLGAIGGVLGASWLAALGLGLIALSWIIQATAWGKDVVSVLADPRDRVSYAALSIAAAVLWLIGALLAAVVLVFRPGFVISSLTLPLVVGFAAQLLIGMMSYLLPSTIGGGPTAVRAGLKTMDCLGMLRWGVVNIGLLLWMLPLASWARVGVSALCCLALAAFLPILTAAVKAQVNAIKTKEGPSVKEMHHGLRPAQFSMALSLLSIVALLGTVASGGISGHAQSAPAAEVQATGTTVSVDISVQDMAYLPAAVTAHPGDHLIINFHNTDSQVHDLHLATGQDTGRVSPGGHATLDVPLVPSEGIDGWCSIAGHRQMGMTFRVNTGTATVGSEAGSHHHADSVEQGETSGMIADPGPDSPTVNPWLAASSPEPVHHVELRASEFEAEVAPGLTQEVWSFGKDPVAPTLRGKVGDQFDITFINDGTMSHSLDFHATMASPDQMTRQISPGETFHYSFIATHAGIWLYHCSTHPMSQHIAAGMHGAVIIDPDDLTPVDHEAVLVGSEIYHNPEDVAAEKPAAWRFNGYAAQYVTAAHPLKIKAGETVRFWVLAAGPNQGMSFHIVGAQFHRVYKEGHVLLDASRDGSGGSQALDLGAAQGGYVEARFEEPGTYTFVDHQMVHAEGGMRGNIIVE